MKVERIKERVEEKEGIPPQQQRLIYSGKQMWVLPPNTNCPSVLQLQDDIIFINTWRRLLLSFSPRNDEKTAADYKIQGGSVLHLVLALRGGSTLHRPCIHLSSSSSWVTVVMGASQRFRCLSQSNHVTAQRNPKLPGQSKQTNKKNHKRQEKKKQKGRSDSFVDVLFCKSTLAFWCLISWCRHPCSTEDRLRTVWSFFFFFLLVNKCWSGYKLVL